MYFLQLLFADAAKVILPTQQGPLVKHTQRADSEPLPEFTLGRDSHPTKAEQSDLCA